MKKRKTIITVFVFLLVVGPVFASASTDTDYQTTQKPDSVSLENEVTPDYRVAAWVAGTVAGWAMGKVYDYMWENVSYSAPSHLCVSLPPEINGQDIEEAFSR
ncbi:hypothetical protein [Piscibacillus salipiscarius]|uniref:Uncharacterized protein n=1 Tax=Piscibacillus salipiscarius TaxID=299480 RepID=A0ABW5QBE9_9BACI|nr:hypothetical protein [Piscibacillus salipiscarius]